MPHSIAFCITAASAADPEWGYSFSLEPEQVRQLIRHLSSAVLASDVKRTEWACGDTQQQGNLIPYPSTVATTHAAQSQTLGSAKAAI